MKRSERSTKERPLPAFRQCPGCRYDFLTGDGTRSCGWLDCPYLPEELKVFCPACNYNFYTGEGDPHCERLGVCEWADEGFARVARIRAQIGSPEMLTPT
ncbi:MAG TPA: hypothetical protein VGB64_02775 [Actinomycetota bacterium]